MPLLFAYFVTVMIWTTTPLAIQWGSEDIGFLASVTARMIIALVIVLIPLKLMGKKLFQSPDDWKVFFIASIGVFPTMPLVYWSAQYIPSGLIPVVMGTSPFITGVVSIFVLQENPFNWRRIVALALAVLGVGVIYLDQMTLGENSVYGVIGIFLSCIVFAISSVWVKRLGGRIEPLRQTAGTLFMAAPGLLISWWLFDGSLPDSVSTKVLLSVGYLSVFGSILGFSLYFYLLSRLSVNVVSLIHLITPVLALWVGVVIENEQLSLRLLMGAGLIIVSLAVYQNVFSTVIGLTKKMNFFPVNSTGSETVESIGEKSN